MSSDDAFLTSPHGSLLPAGADFDDLCFLSVLNVVHDALLIALDGEERSYMRYSSHDIPLSPSPLLNLQSNVEGSSASVSSLHSQDDGRVDGAKQTYDCFSIYNEHIRYNRSRCVRFLELLSVSLILPAFCPATKMLFMTPNPPTKALVALSLFSAARAAVVGSAAQTFVGIGGSGAWWPIDVYKFPEAQKQKISDLLFSDSGLGLSHYRWNVGGGGVGVGNPSRAPEMFWTGPGQYDWSKDPQGVYFMKEANKRGSIITAFANSAPAPLTSSNASCDGQFNAGTGGVYGTYLADVIQHFIGEGINIKYVSPMNEPDNNFGDIPCGQEGMQVWPTDRAEVVTGLWDALNARGLASKVGITADETTWVSIATAEDFLWVNSVKDKLVALAHHTYDFPANWVYSLYLTQTSGYNVQTWMTEVCCSLGQADGTGRGWSQGYDPTITNALMWAGLVFQSMVYANEARYDFWTLASSAIGCDPSTNATCPSTPNSQGWTDGLIYYDSNFASNHNYELYLTKHFWTYKHFGNYVKPGMKRLNVGSKSSSDSANLDYVLVSSSDSAYNVILMNPTNGATTLTLQFPTDACAQKAFRTSEKEDFASVNKAAVQSDGKTWSLAVAPMSLTTYTFSKSKC